MVEEIGTQNLTHASSVGRIGCAPWDKKYLYTIWSTRLASEPNNMIGTFQTLIQEPVYSEKVHV